MIRCYLRTRKATNRPSKRPFDIFLQEGVLLLDSVPVFIHRKREENVNSEKRTSIISVKISKRIRAPRYLIDVSNRNGVVTYGAYQGSSATTLGWLKISAALCLLLVGIGSPAGV